MSANRITAVLFVLAIAALAAATSSRAAPKAGQPLEDFALRHPVSVSQPSEDFAIRHPLGLSQPSADLSAYYAGSDYAQRHALSSIDTSDYFLRHPELSSQ